MKEDKEVREIKNCFFSQSAADSKGSGISHLLNKFFDQMNNSLCMQSCV